MVDEEFDDNGTGGGDEVAEADTEPLLTRFVVVFVRLSLLNVKLGLVILTGVNLDGMLTLLNLFLSFCCTYSISKCLVSDILGMQLM